MRNHLTVTIRTVSGQHRYQIPVFWIGFLLMILCFTLGTFHLYPPVRPHPSSMGSSHHIPENAPPSSLADPFLQRIPEPGSPPTSNRMIPNLIPEVESLDDFFDPNIDFGNNKKKEETTKPKNGQNRKPQGKTVVSPDKLKNQRPLSQTVAQHRESMPRPPPGFEKIILDMIPNGSPVAFKGINSPFGTRSHPKSGSQQFHPGIDLQADMKTPIRTTADGVIEFAGFESINSYGNLVTIHHNYGFQTSYAHLYDILVKNGDFVKKGDIIGHSGNSGLSSGPHLHYEVRFVHRILDPTGFLNWDSNNLNQLFSEKQVAWQSLIDHINRRPNHNELPLPLRIALTQGGYKPL